MNLAALQHLRSVSIYMYYCENLAQCIQHAGWWRLFTQWKLNCCLGAMKQW